MKLTALIPAYNDDYALSFCLSSIVDYFDEIIVLDDASTDHTPDVALDCARRHPHVRYYRHEGAQLGWIEARNRLAALTDSEHLFWLDSDDVLCGYNADLFEEITESGRAAVQLQLTEMWGDFHHTTQRLRHYDRCHFYMNRRLVGDFRWTGGTCARCEPRGTAGLTSRVLTGRSPGPLFFHIKGVKSDHRLLERRYIRRWLRERAGAGRLGEFPFAYMEDAETDSIATAPIDEWPESVVHAAALDMLLKSRQDHLVLSYNSPFGLQPSALSAAAPRRPEVIEAALPGRFEIVYQNGAPVDRMDHGWSCTEADRLQQLTGKADLEEDSVRV